MITRNALYTVIEDLIAAAVPGDALFEAVSYRNLRGAVDTVQKTVRIESFVGQHVMTTENMRKEANVQTTIQTWCLPAGTDDADLDTAMDTAFEMSRELFEGLAANTDLNGAVCDSYFDGFETGYANIGATRYGVTWLDGLINQAS